MTVVPAPSGDTISMLFAALIGGRLLGEGDRGQRILGAVLMAVGVALLAL